MSFSIATRRSAVTVSCSNAPRPVQPVSCTVSNRTGRREALGYVATILTGGALLTATRAEAIDVPFQESLLGNKAMSSSEQSMSAYDMEGIKKTALSRKERKKILEEVRERALGNVKP